MAHKSAQAGYRCRADWQLVQDAVGC
jgi:hypothetical protein